MARGISLSLLSDVRDFLRGTKSAADSLEVIGHALDEVVADSDRAQSAMEADFTAIAREANAAGDKVGASFDTAGDRATASSGRIRDGFKGTGDELRQEGLEGAASFDGSMESAADSAQAFSSVALSAFGPIGVALGVAAAAGFGAFRAQAERTKEKIQEVFDALVEGQGRLNDSFKDSTLQEWAKDGTLERLAKQATDLGISYDVAVRASLSEANAMLQVAEATEAATQAQAAAVPVSRGAGIAYSSQRQALEGLNRTVEANAGTTADAEETYDLYAAAVEGAGIQTDAMTDATEAATDALNAQATALLESRGLLRDVEQAYDDALKQVKEYGKGLDITTQRGRDNQAALDSLAATILADGKVRKDERDKFLEVAEAMGLAERAAEKLARRLELMPRDTKVSVRVEVDPATLAGVQNKLRAQGFRWDGT